MSNYMDEIAELGKARERVKTAIEGKDAWREEAREDYNFIRGKQWTDGDLDYMKKNGRPAITINRCRPIINLLCGYAAQNETEPDFLPRSEEDDSIARVAKGITKYVLDRANYQSNKKRVFRDKVSVGMGAYWVWYEYDEELQDGQVHIDRLHPFDVFIDPESTHEGLEDAEFCGRYSWESPDKLAQVYPDKADEILLIQHKLDSTETEEVLSPMWYQKDLKKVRVVQYWYKKYITKEVLDVNGLRTIPSVQMCYMTFADNVLLENGESAYKHNSFPLVLDYCYYTEENSDSAEPAGVIRDIKDAQRELNKNRSQRMNIVNKQSLGVRLWQGPIDDIFKKTIKSESTKPGADIFLPSGVTYQDMTPSAQSLGNIELESQANSDFYTISGITPESLSGSVGAMSGKAIDLRQSVTTVQTAEIFDKSKEAERRIMKLLWGDKHRQGLIPQFYNQEKAYRILGDDGQKEFVKVSPNGMGQAVQKQMQFDAFGNPMVDEEGNPIVKVLYDLSAFDFDIIITTSTASATARKANLYQLLEAKQAGVDIPLDVIISFMDFPGKEEVKQRIRQQSEAPKLPDIRLSGGIDDLPAEALSIALQSIGVNISPAEILQERLALKGKLPQVQAVPQAPMQQPQPTPQIMGPIDPTKWF